MRLQKEKGFLQKRIRALAKLESTFVKKKKQKKTRKCAQKEKLSSTGSLPVPVFIMASRC
jgi:hypothetical protein